ncbi:hypothetical protein FB567DRAFT_537431 [Paraphoma chrysanthemicola]|uniref:Uncharacterized protein n=1 Tax=Paraphoma chrysanthemicola TaxID=798071 RepID=A0A8K0QXD2_9PLEO|nr:hypothetical protein FB567DRAFT_537431 [Paraphoma chrysanthemicola]
MVFFRNKKKFERAQIHQQRTQDELDELKRQHDYDEEQRKKTQSRQQEEWRKEKARQEEERQKMQHQMMLEREDNRRREEERQRAEVERQRAAEESRLRAQENEERKRRIIQEKQIADRKLEEEKRLRIKQASSETLRDLRELIRDRYELDVKIWGLRGARKPDHPIVQKKMVKSDAVMEEILHMVSLWGDNSDNNWNPVEWEKVNIIRTKLEDGGHRVWANDPPWADNER